MEDLRESADSPRKCYPARRRTRRSKSGLASSEEVPDGGAGHPAPRKENLVSLIDESNDDAVVEECIGELDEVVMALDRYPPTAVAVALGTYLEGLLGALLDDRQCTADEVRQLLREIESGVLQPQVPSKE